MFMPPKLNGTIKISSDENRILIAGDPKGLLSLSELLAQLANYDQNSDDDHSSGWVEHVHLHRKDHLTLDSFETEITRMDPKP